MWTFKANLLTTPLPGKAKWSLFVTTHLVYLAPFRLDTATLVIANFTRTLIGSIKLL